MATGKSGVILTVDEKRAIIESCGLDEKRLMEDRDIIIEWCSKEEHLKDAVPYLAKTCIVERLVLLCKGSVEEAKMKVDRLLRIRSILPELCLKRELSQFDQIHKYLKCVQMPKLTSETHERIMIVRYLPVENYNDFDFLWQYKLPIYIMEHRFCDDISIVERYVIDFRNVKLGILARVVPSVLQKVETFWTNGHGLRFKGFHILDAPYLAEKLVFISKQVLKPKIVDRIYVHLTIKDLHKYIPKEVLPSDLEGDGPSFDELYDRWREIMQTQEAKQKMADLDKLVSDESKRINAQFDEEQLGIPGSFRKLEFD